jgi:hypothetical protein
VPRQGSHRLLLFALAMFYATATTEISEAQQEGYTNEESNLCAGKKSFSYKANGEQHFVPYEVIDDQVVIEGDIVVGSAEDLLKGGANYVPPVVLDLIDGQWTRWGNGVAPYVVPFVIDSSAEAYRSWIRDATLAWSSPSIIFVERKEKPDWLKENYINFMSGTTDKKHWICRSNSFGVRKKVGGSKEEENINVVWVLDAVRGAVSPTRSDTY